MEKTDMKCSNNTDCSCYVPKTSTECPDSCQFGKFKNGEIWNDFTYDWWPFLYIIVVYVLIFSILGKCYAQGTAPPASWNMISLSKCDDQNQSWLVLTFYACGYKQKFWVLP